jgi:hypothetical protein
MIFNRDLTKFCEECNPDRNEGVKTIATFMLMIMAISLMGWAFLPRYDLTPPTPTLTKEQMHKLTVSQLAANTYLLNEEMKRRTAK